MDATRSDGPALATARPDAFNSSALRTAWHKSAPGAVRKAFRAGKEAKGWSAWTKHLAKRDSPVALAKLLPGKGSPLAWVLPDDDDEGRTPQVLAEIERLGLKSGRGAPAAQSAALGWLADAAGRRPDAGYALEALAWCHALPRLAASLEPDAWYDLLEHLLGVAGDARAARLVDDPLNHQLLAGELPLALGYLFPEISACRELIRPARQSLSAGLVELLDGEGLPHADYLDVVRPLLACWTRCRAMGDGSDKGVWNKTAQIQYEWLVRQALRLTRVDGTHVFSGGRSGMWCEDLFRAALRLGGDRTDAAVAAVVLPAQKEPVPTGPGKLRLPKEAAHSEWAGLGILRAGWAPSDPWLVVAYPGQSVRIEMQSREELLASGPWEFAIRRDGRLIGVESEWEQVCWLSDDDADYLELEIELEDGLRVQRHMLLAREDHFLLLADAVLGDRPARLESRLEYCGRVSLAANVSFQPAEETREGFLSGRRRLGLALPLALGEWRADAAPGSLVRTDEGLELRQETEGRSMFAPLFVDLRPGRMTRRLTWRPLTVAETLRVLPDDAAVGYRVAIGKEQWLIYRSLAPVGNRTLLGHNLTSEMLVARFDRDGEVEPLAEIE